MCFPVACLRGLKDLMGCLLYGLQLRLEELRNRKKTGVNERVLFFDLVRAIFFFVNNVRHDSVFPVSIPLKECCRHPGSGTSGSPRIFNKPSHLPYSGFRWRITRKVGM